MTTVQQLPSSQTGLSCQNTNLFSSYKYQRLDNCSGPVLAGALKVDRVYRNLSKHEPPVDATKAIPVQDLIIDSSAGWRAFGDLYPEKFPFLSDPIAQGVGFTTGLCAAEGAFMFADTLERFKFARTIGDTTWAKLEGATLVRDGMLFAVGAAYAAYRPLRIATFYRGVEIGPAAQTALGQAAYGTVTVGNGLLGTFYLTNLGLSTYKLSQSISLKSALTVDVLTEKLRDPTTGDVSATDDELRTMVKARAGAWIDQMLDKMDQQKMLLDRPNLTESQCEEVAWRMLNENQDDIAHELRTQWPDLAEELLKLHNNDPILAMGHALKIDAERIKKLNELTLVLGADVVKELKAKDAITQADVDQTKEALKGGTGWLLASIFLNLAGLAWVVFSYISNPVASWVYALQSLLCAIVDGKVVKDWLANIQAGKGDMRMALISIATAVVSIILVSLLFAHLGLPVWVLLIALTMDTLWIGVNGFVIYKISQPNLDHPELHDFSRFLQTCTDNGKANQIFARMDSEIQECIRCEIASYHRNHLIVAGAEFTAVDFRRATAALERAKALEEKRDLEALKAQLLPCIQAVVYPYKDE